MGFYSINVVNVARKRLGFFCFIFLYNLLHSIKNIFSLEKQIFAFLSAWRYLDSFSHLQWWSLLHDLKTLFFAEINWGAQTNGNQRRVNLGDITTRDGTPLKLVDEFTYRGSSVSSTEKDIDTRLTKAWRPIDRLSIIWKSDLTDKIKHSFFQAAVVSIYYCCMDALLGR